MEKSIIFVKYWMDSFFLYHVESWEVNRNLKRSSPQ